MSLVVSAALLAGCAAPGSSETRTKACDKDRTVVVSVEDAEKLVVNLEPVYVCGKNVKITWELSAADFQAGYVFSDASFNKKKGRVQKSIEVDAPAGEFYDCKTHANGMRFTCADKGDTKQTFKYTVIVRKPRSGPGVDEWTTPLDPNVVNE